MQIVQQKVFVNKNESEVNAWLAQIPAENIVSVSYHINGTEQCCDEFTTVFYKTER